MMEQSHAGALLGYRPRRPPPYSGASRIGVPKDLHQQ
jgi:hypothetical protein